MSRMSRFCLPKQNENDNCYILSEKSNIVDRFVIQIHFEHSSNKWAFYFHILQSVYANDF